MDRRCWTADTKRRSSSGCSNKFRLIPRAVRLLARLRRRALVGSEPSTRFSPRAAFGQLRASSSHTVGPSSLRAVALCMLISLSHRHSHICMLPDEAPGVAPSLGRTSGWPATASDRVQLPAAAPTPATAAAARHESLEPTQRFAVSSASTSEPQLELPARCCHWVQRRTALAWDSGGVYDEQ